MADIGKRKRSEEGLLGLLGTYASEDEEYEAGEQGSPSKLQRLEAADSGQARPDRADSEENEPLVDIAVAVAAASQRRAAEAEAEQNPGAAVEDSPQKPPVEEAVMPEGEEEDKDAYWLPPELAEPPFKPCPENIQERVAHILRKQEATGLTISGSLRSMPAYRNPDFLQHCVVYDNISEFGTCYPPEIFDPNNLPAEDFYDRLAAEWERLQEKRQQERIKTNRVDFAKGGTENMGRSTAAGLNPATVAANIVAQAKARSSKWDAKR